MTSISIIIPHYNNYQILNDCLESLYESELHDAEVIIVNNNSTDDSIKKIITKFSKPIIISTPTNLGYAGGCNYGAKHAKGELLVFLNNDTEVDKEWLSQLIKTMENQTHIASVQPKILNKNNQKTFDYAGASGGFIDKYCYPFARGRIFNTIENDDGQYDDIKRIFWASGTGFITRKSIFNELRGFDENLFAHMEEIDYHWKCQLNGYEVYANPKSVIYHLGGGTLSYQSAYKTYLNHRNSLLLLLSNYNLINTIKFSIIRIMMECISCMKDLVSLRFKHAFAQINSLLWIIVHPHIIIRRRKIIKKIRKKTDKELINDIIFNKSIVYQYFIKKNRKYQSL
tara:strand:- start:495 stop:1520 length:1026 start_codon:yes stop_codon:yes gene_type:complete